MTEGERIDTPPYLVKKRLYTVNALQKGGLLAPRPMRQLHDRRRWGSLRHNRIVRPGTKVGKLPKAGEKRLPVFLKESIY